MSLSLDAQRALTKRFIDEDPMTIVLIPRVRSVNDAGHTVEVDGTPRDPQTFKLSLLGHDQRPISTVSGQERRIEYHLIGEHDAIVEIGDHWEDEGGTRFEVLGLTDGFGYMVKALVYRHLPVDSEVT